MSSKIDINNTVYITEEEKQEIRDVIQKVYDSVMLRCKESGSNEIQISMSTISIQDLLGGIDCDEHGLRF